MRTLAIETAGEACSVALFRGDVLIAHEHETIGRGHAERLVPMIERLPEKGRAQEILVSLGPGSFTGVRIGLAAGRALGLVWGAVVLGYPTLALVSAIARDRGAKNVGVCVNGGHGEWFVQSFDGDGRPVDDLSSVSPRKALVSLAGQVVAGNRANQFAELSTETVQAIDLLADARHVPSIPRDLLTDKLSPIYGRAPDAKVPGR